MFECIIQKVIIDMERNEGEIEMTIPHSKAWYELQWAMHRRNTLVFKDKVSVGQLVFLFNVSTYMWTPYWVVDERMGCMK